MALILPLLARFRLPLAAGLLIVLALGYAWHRAAESGRAAEQRAEGRRAQAAQAEVARREAAAAQISALANAQLSVAAARIEVRTRTLREKVPIYVTAQSDADCRVPGGFVSLWNAGAAGEALPAIPAPAGGPDAAASGPPLSAVLDATLANDGIAYSWRAEALTWRQWYADQKAAWEKR